MKLKNDLVKNLTLLSFLAFGACKEYKLTKEELDVNNIQLIRPTIFLKPLSQFKNPHNISHYPGVMSVFMNRMCGILGENKKNETEINNLNNYFLSTSEKISLLRTGIEQKKFDLNQLNKENWQKAVNYLNECGKNANIKDFEVLELLGKKVENIQNKENKTGPYKIYNLTTSNNEVINSSSFQGELIKWRMTLE